MGSMCCGPGPARVETQLGVRGQGASRARRVVRVVVGAMIVAVIVAPWSRSYSMMDSPMDSRATLDDLATPCLLLDLDVVERNLRQMAGRAADLGVALRPHIKTHKCIE